MIKKNFHVLYMLEGVGMNIWFQFDGLESRSKSLLYQSLSCEDNEFAIIYDKLD